MKKFKKLMTLLMVLLLIVGCQDKNEPEESITTPPPVVKPDEPLVNESQTITYPLPIDGAITDKLKDLGLSLKLLVMDNKSSQLIAKVDNNSKKTISNVKVNVHYNHEDVDRILYTSSEVAPGGTTNDFKIMGPISNQVSDIVIKDITVQFTDDSELVAINPNSDVKPPETKPEDPETETPETDPNDPENPETDPNNPEKDPQEPTVDPVSSKTLNLYRFGGFILEAADTIPTFGISDNGEVVMNVTNKTPYPIKEYTMTVSINNNQYTFVVNNVIAPGASMTSAPQTIDSADLNTTKPIRLSILADYNATRNLAVDYILSGKISANYKIVTK